MPHADNVSDKLGNEYWNVHKLCIFFIDAAIGSNKPIRLFKTTEAFWNQQQIDRLSVHSMSLADSA